MQNKIIHPIEPIFDEASEILILGSFPSVKSREERFYYAHPQNRFWKVLASVFGSPVPDTIQAKKAFLKEHHIALWDVIAACEIEGSSDGRIRNAVPNDLSKVLSVGKIKCIFLNGRTAEKYFNKYDRAGVTVKEVCLPSTSPANAAWGIDRLTEEWMIIKNV